MCWKYFRMPQDYSSLERSFSLLRNCGVSLTLCGILIIAFLLLNLTGCTVKGFANVPEGQPTTPTQLRSAAAIARAEAQALDQIADNQEGFIRDMVSKVQGAAESLGAPALLTGLLGGAAGFLTPTPGQRRRQDQAKAEGKLEGVVSSKS